MKRIFYNIFESKAPVIVILRYLLIGAILLMGLARFRITLLLLTFPENFKERDILQIYLMAKAQLSGMNPYTPLNMLAERFIGSFPYFPHPAPYPPFNLTLFLPLLTLGIRDAVIAWYIFELLCLGVISCLVIILWKGQLTWIGVVIMFMALLAFFPIMADLEVGQLSILITLLLLSAFLALQTNHRILAGIFIGISTAIKLITWPLILYYILKKDWKVAFSSMVTVVSLNFISLAVIGPKPFIDYFIKVSTVVMNYYKAELANYSLWSFGYRLFSGTGTTVFKDSLIAPPLINYPAIAPIFSITLVIAFITIGLIFALRSTNQDIAFAILICVILISSPVVWDHYFVIIIICLLILFKYLKSQDFPDIRTLIFLIPVILLLLFNDQIGNITMVMNNGTEFVRSNGNHITFISALLFTLPVIEVIILSILLWCSSISDKKELSAQKDDLVQN